MYRLPFPERCAECGAALGESGWGRCLSCLQVFCDRHLSGRADAVACTSCERRRRDALEGARARLEEDEMRLVQLISDDLAATVGSTLEDVVVEAAARVREFASDRDSYRQQVVDDVQQYVHDAYIDTTWPACPMHPNHPLWLSDGWWRCEHAGVPIAELGRLQPAPK